MAFDLDSFGTCSGTGYSGLNMIVPGARAWRWHEGPKDCSITLSRDKQPGRSGLSDFDGPSPTDTWLARDNLTVIGHTAQY